MIRSKTAHELGSILHGGIALGIGGQCIYQAQWTMREMFNYRGWEVAQCKSQVWKATKVSQKCFITQ